MTRRKVKEGICPKCSKQLFRIKLKKDKSTKCNYCGHVIQNPREVFKPR